MITRLAHVCFWVNDLERAVHFYEDVLGFRRAFEFTGDDGKPFGAYLKAGERVFIELFSGKAESNLEGQSYRHICLEVDDIEATVEELRAKGVEVGKVSRGKDQSWQAWLSDPEGNRIELHQYTPESWQTPHLG